MIIRDYNELGMFKISYEIWLMLLAYASKTSIPFGIPSFMYGNNKDNGYNNNINHNNNNNNNIIRSHLCFIPLALRRHIPQFTWMYNLFWYHISDTVNNINYFAKTVPLQKHVRLG